MLYTTGLAISLVGTSEEKVWYHSNCKNRGKGCTNTRLVSQKGCCIWYKETVLFQDVEKRVGHFIDRKLPDVKSLDIYGEDEKEEAGVKSMHLEKLRPAVQELAIMAKESQNHWLNMTLTFNGIIKNKNKHKTKKMNKGYKSNNDRSSDHRSDSTKVRTNNKNKSKKKKQKTSHSHNG